MREALIHAIESLTGNRPNVRVYHTNEGRHNLQNDNGNAYTCGIHAARNAESWIFNNRNLYTQNLDIIRERNRMIRRLDNLIGMNIPHYESPRYEIDNDENRKRINSELKKPDEERKKTEQERNTEAKRKKRENPEFKKKESEAKKK